MIGRVFTRSFTFETKQHNLLGLDLGEGVPRRALVVGSIIVLAWFTLLTLLFGLPNGRTLTFYLTIPGIIVWYGFQPSTKVSRRKQITDWILNLRWITIGHKGIINGDLARRRDWLTLRERLPLDRLIQFFKQAPDVDPWTRQEAESRPFKAAEAITLAQTATLTSPQAMATLRKKVHHG